MTTAVVDDALLAEVVRRILSVGSPWKVIVFGSHARGDARPDSDLDLLIVEENSSVPRHKRATRYRMAMTGLDLHQDIEVWTPEEIAEWANVPLAFITTILREGRTIYEGPRRSG